MVLVVLDFLGDQAKGFLGDLQKEVGFLDRSCCCFSKDGTLQNMW